MSPLQSKHLIPCTIVTFGICACDDKMYPSAQQITSICVHTITVHLSKHVILCGDHASYIKLGIRSKLSSNLTTSETVTPAGKLLSPIYNRFDQTLRTWRIFQKISGMPLCGNWNRNRRMHSDNSTQWHKCIYCVYNCAIDLNIINHLSLMISYQSQHEVQQTIQNQDHALHTKFCQISLKYWIRYFQPYNLHLFHINPLVPRRSGCNFYDSIFNFVLLIGIFWSYHDNAHGWMHGTLLVTSQHWPGWWLGAAMQQAIAWANIDPVHCHHTASLGSNGLTAPHRLTEFYRYLLIWHSQYEIFKTGMKINEHMHQMLMIYCNYVRWMRR